MRLVLPLTLTLLATSALADTNTLVAENGLVGAVAQLSAQTGKTPSDQFALGALHFLRGIEKTLQVRWEYNATIDDLDLPVLRLPVPPNPDAKPFRADLITGLFAELLKDMDASRAALAEIPDGADVALDLNLANLWFDINMNGKRDLGEGVIEVGANTLMGEINFGEMDGIPPMDVRFDTADVAWLTAYTHMVSAAGEMVVAFDPTEAIETVMNANAKMIELRGNAPQQFGFDMQFGGWVDQFAMAYGALNKQPDATHTRAAHAHLLSMISENKVFWAAVAQETDNEREWIPNDNQTAALGFKLAPGTGAAWQAVLADVEALLNGDLLIEYWRISPAGGVNVKKLFMDPPVVDIVTWVQGSGLLPYLERGPVISSRNLEEFDELTGGNIFLMSFMLN
ncbi:hypothetical protein [Profundibacter amoris]|uniref:Uncharacterized protein n=1 Tax=Profundibacter amoris TaxID=2171755 RepID=A0A347UJI8_9RHOB|nr:hypothetical protein [Profundibacter amoris]AXX99016.1 hypothetical protein BAR1_14410 [Profundibacter amoris]